jgi:hypothetical protein
MEPDSPMFDQRNQQVTYQYNAANNINFDNIQSMQSLAEQLERLRSETKDAAKKDAIDKKKASNAEQHLANAVREARKKEPNKTKLTDYLNHAKSVLKGVRAVTGLAGGIAKAIQQVGRLF